jgi:uncharacterized protein (DUF58 family)
LNIFKQYYFDQKTYLVSGIIVFLYIFAYFFPSLAFIPDTFLILFLITVFLDLFLLAKKIEINISRKVPEKMSLGDENEIFISFEASSSIELFFEIIDDAPDQFQLHDLSFKSDFKEHTNKQFKYVLKPTERGLYQFKSIYVFLQTNISFIKRRYEFKQNFESAVYPSYQQMIRDELYCVANKKIAEGENQLRRLGQSKEFEQIKSYVHGDEYRSVNWKATARTGKLMTNLYQIETAQDIYMILDKGRMLKFPFNGMTLMDYAINASLSLGNIILKRNDRLGFLSFDTKFGQMIKAERNHKQLGRLMEALYKQESNYKESNFELLYQNCTYLIPQRSLLIIFTNFENMDSLKRNIRYLQALSKRHAVLILNFINTEIEDYSQKETESVDEIYIQTMADDYLFEKQKMVSELSKYGIFMHLARPFDLSLKAINAYLKIKDRGMI